MTTAIYTHARTFGRGARPALAIHCTLAHAGAWQGGQCLKDVLTLATVDLLGHGKSGGWEGRSDLYSFAPRPCATL